MKAAVTETHERAGHAFMVYITVKLGGAE